MIARSPIALVIALLAVLLAPVAAWAADPLVVHEWGTFTSLQDEQGRTIGGINTDEEALPKFVHDLLRGRTDGLATKGIPGGARHEVTMRLETPVIYFHPPQGSPQQSVDVSVQFRGGLLSQFYPDAITNVEKGSNIPSINEKTLGWLRWNGIKIGTNTPGPKTDSHVWLAPRQVSAADVTAGNGESERYLFYRGVGHLDAPIVSIRQADQLTFAARGNFTSRHLWLAHFAANGSCEAYEFSDLSPAKRIEFSFSGINQPVLDLPQLRASMKQALISDGLYDDEAEAMLNTWQKSYFRSSGLRLFYLVPRNWTDQVLPLKLSTEARIERVMIGRLEMISSEQQKALHELAAIDNISKEMKRSWDLYNSLGRFKSALVQNEQFQRPMTGLKQIINLYGL